MGGDAPGLFARGRWSACGALRGRITGPEFFPSNSRSGDVEKVGHYTQLIWRNSRRVGCATAVGRYEEFLVCRYSEAGNISGQRPI